MRAQKHFAAMTSAAHAIVAAIGVSMVTAVPLSAQGSAPPPSPPSVPASSAPASADVVAAQTVQPVPPVFIAPIQLDMTQRMTLPVTINGQGPYGFVVDTGAERTVISRELANALRLPGRGRARVVGIAEATMSDMYQVDRMALSSVELGGIVVPTFPQTDLGTHGLIGIDGMENHRILIDFRARRIDMRPSERSRRPIRDAEMDRDAIVVTGRRVEGRLILSNAEINGTHIDIVVDTGAQGSLGNAALRRLVMRQQGQRRATTAGSVTGVTGGHLPVAVGSISRIKVAGVDFTNLPVAYGESPAFAVLGLNRRPALLLGMDALSLFDRVSIDFPNRRVLFDLPDGASLGRPQRNAMTGVGDPRGTDS